MHSFGHAGRVIVCICLSLASGIVFFEPPPRVLRADDVQDDSEKHEAQARKERFTNWMRTYAEGTEIRLAAKDDGEEQLAELVPKPVFRYSDVEQRIPDGTLWVWTQNARPVAFQKVEGNNYGQRWTICFASLSEGLLDVSWANGMKFTARKPGVKFSPFPRADVPADNSRARTAQLKALKDRFTARLKMNNDGTGGAEARTMPKSLFEYSDPETKLPVGAIFGITSTGTNPDLLLLIEARRDGDGRLRWEYAYARMTANGVRLRLDDAEIWTEKAVATAAFDNWIFYFLPRDFQ